MIKVKFYDCIEDRLLKFAVIVSMHKGKWVFCKHKERNTYECPGGRREESETTLETARRELWEETGAVRFDLREVCVYSVIKESEETFGMLYFAEVEQFEKLPFSEIEKIEFFDELPESWTYPLIQPKLIEKIKKEVFI